MLHSLNAAHTLTMSIYPNQIKYITLITRTKMYLLTIAHLVQFGFIFLLNFSTGKFNICGSLVTKELSSRMGCVVWAGFWTFSKWTTTKIRPNHMKSHQSMKALYWMSLNTTHMALEWNGFMKENKREESETS